MRFFRSAARGEGRAPPAAAPLPAAAPPSPETAVGVLYEALLHRPADPGGLATYAGGIARGECTLRDVAAEMLGSREYRGRTGRMDAFGTPVAIPFMGCTFHVAEDSEVAGDLRAPGGYEPWVLPRFLDELRPGMRVLDLGASWGLFALPAARRVGPAGRVFALEVSARNCRVLLRNARANGFAWLEVLPFGVSDRLGAELLPVQTGSHNNTIHDTGTVEGEALDRYEVVPVLPLDALRGPLGRIDVVKMDVEGMEHRVAQGGRALFEAERPVVYLEYSPGLLRDVSGVPAAALLRFFLERGYAVEILHRTAPPESLAGLDAETAIARTDAACERHVREEAGTHLDLCLRPIGAPAPALNGA